MQVYHHHIVTTVSICNSFLINRFDCSRGDSRPQLSRLSASSAGDSCTACSKAQLVACVTDVRQIVGLKLPRVDYSAGFISANNYDANNPFFR